MPAGRAAGFPWPLAVAALLVQACDVREPQRLERSSRCGVFRDLVLYERSAAQGGPFFLDRFETTRRDWFAYLRATGQDTEATPWGSGAPSAAEAALPVSRVTLAQARRFARWRFGRLPRLDEWQFAATGRGAYSYPWGETFRAAWVNSAELGFARPTPVGTFESGRDDGGAYDLLGNVAEWTESVDFAWFGPGERASMPAVSRGLSRLATTAAAGLRRWRPPGVPWPSGWWVWAAGPELPRLVVGGHYRATVRVDARAPQNRDGLWQLWERGPRERGDTLGVRIATDPRQLLVALLREPQQLAADEARELRELLRRPRCNAVLAPVFAALRGEVGEAGPLLELLEQELGA